MAGGPPNGNINNLGFRDQPGTGLYGSNNTMPMASVTNQDWRLFFGEPKGPIETNPYGPFKRENFALPDAYRGVNNHLTNVIITLIQVGALPPDPRPLRVGQLPYCLLSLHQPGRCKLGSSCAYHKPLPPIESLVQDEDMWPTRIALPFRLSEGEMEIVWDEIYFNNSLLGPVPEEGVSRLVTQQVSIRIRGGAGGRGVVDEEAEMLALGLHCKGMRMCVWQDRRSAAVGFPVAHHRTPRPHPATR